VTTSIHNSRQPFFQFPSSLSTYCSLSQNQPHHQSPYPTKTTENGHEMINFMHDEDYTDHNNNSGPSNTCTDLDPSPSLLILYPLFKNNIKETKNKSRNRQKLNDSLAGDNLPDQVDDVMLPYLHSNPSSHLALLASVHQTNKVNRAVSIAGSKSKVGKNWPTSCWLMILGWQVATQSLWMTVFLLAP
jgi:hypothetical protein